jgi:hypothetical protein
MSEAINTVAALEQRLTGLQTDLATEIHHTLVEGGDATDLLRERTDAEAKVTALSGAIKTVDKQLQEAYAREWPIEASKRMLAVHRLHQSLYVEYEEDIARVQNDVSKVAEDVDRMNARYRRLEDLLCEALVLNSEFGTEIPPALFERYIQPNSVGVVIDAVKRLRNVKPADAESLPTVLHHLPYRSSYGIGWTVGSVLRRIEGTPTHDLIDRAGSPELSDRALWEAKRGRLINAARDAADAARLEDGRNYDEWLKVTLCEATPVEEVKRLAREQGLRLDADRNHRGASIQEARPRVRVLLVTRNADNIKQDLWILSDQFDPEEFTLVNENKSPLAGIRS